MLKFTSEQDLSCLPKTNPAHHVISTLVKGIITDTLDTEYPYDPDADGFIALVEPDDVNRPLHDIWPDGDWKLSDLPYEGVTLQDGHYLAIYLANNQYGIVFVIPDEDWVTGDLRECIERNLDPPHEIERQQSSFEQEEI